MSERHESRPVNMEEHPWRGVCVCVCVQIHVVNKWSDPNKMWPTFFSKTDKADSSVHMEK